MMARMPDDTPSPRHIFKETTMHTQQGRMFQSLENVRQFLDEHTDKLAAVITTGTRRELDEAIAALAVHAADQSGNALIAQGATQKQRALRQALLHDHMAPIARIAKARLPRTPEMAPLRMPRSNPAVQRLVTAAHGMAKAAAPFTDVFVAAGLPAEFLTQLNAAAEALVQSVSARSQSRSRRTSATKGLKTTLTAGRQIVHILDAFIQTALKDDPILLAGWNAVKRVQNIGMRSATTTVIAIPAPVPTPAPTPATADVAVAA
jgi:hypothetical protein